ncbi:hypothetical protein ARMGADRAFT_1101663 [Armillaria gallica]|uniref:Uncharacterized protein n=1 Tax=Armillaria gallica TaxID=47427 RepID=A0A2H3DHH2_ARMGA|nr:hypothetical protein ARMGADRAFT_1101663 [Armillaria gallica]
MVLTTTTTPLNDVVDVRSHNPPRHNQWVKTDRTAKECWDSIIAEHAKKTDMALSEAEVLLNAVKFDGNSNIDTHVADLRMKRRAVNDLCTTALSDQEFKGIIIHSIIPTDHWMPILLSLYQMPTSSNIISHLQTHAATLCAMRKGPSQSQALVARAPPTHRCCNPNCKACDKTQHMMENCYWPGGEKEATTNNMANTTRHFVLAARMTTIEVDHNEEGLIVQDGSTGERIYEWNGTHSFWQWEEPDSDSESASSAEFSEWSSTFGSETESFTDYSEMRDETDLDMPPLTDFSDNKEEDVHEDDEMPPLVDPDFDEDEAEEIGQFACEADPARMAFVTTTFEGCTPSVTLTFMDSSASNYFFHNCEDFVEYTPVAFCTGSSAIEGKGTFEILGQGTVTKTFRLDGKDVKLTFKNALHSLSLAANLISMSTLDKADPNINPLELVATDLWGPSRTASPSGKTYMMIFVDSGTSFKAGEFLADKADDMTMAAFDSHHPGVVPAEAFSKRCQDVSFLHVFGSTCWVKKPTSGGVLVDSRSKLKDRSKKCIFLGYAGSNYHVLNQLGHMFVSRDVILDEGPAHQTMSVGETEDEPPLNTSATSTSSSSSPVTPPTELMHTAPVELTLH